MEQIKKGVDKKFERRTPHLDPRKVQLNASLYFVAS